MVVEALAVGTPVIASETGGVTEILRDGWNGVVVPRGDASALGDAIRGYLDDPALQERLRAEAVGSVARFAPEAIYPRLERLLAEAARAR
jgi:glycosyltransferase involved in cell wall biosynthesis